MCQGKYAHGVLSRSQRLLSCIEITSFPALLSPIVPEFDEWQYFTAQSLLRQYEDALHRLVRIHERDQNFELAIEYAHQRSTLDLLNESAHRDLMSLHARLGQRSMAMQQYRDLRPGAPGGTRNASARGDDGAI